MQFLSPRPYSKVGFLILTRKNAMNSWIFKLLASAVLVFLTNTAFINTAAYASEPVERTNTSTLWFESWGKLTNATLIVVNPEGVRTDVFAISGSPTFHLRDVAPVIDGVYSYELLAATDEMVTIRNQLDNGRGKAQKKQVSKPFLMNGFFIVSRGVITVQKALIEE